MITRISVENFKGIGERVELELRPITLLFGANSAGKSSVVHALHYAREVFERHNLDADETIAGGKYIDLGGFEHFIHRGPNSDASSEVVLRLDVGVPPTGLPTFDADLESVVGNFMYELRGLLRGGNEPLPFNLEPIEELSHLNLNVLARSVSSAAVEIRIGWSSIAGCPYVSSTRVMIDGVSFAEIVANANRRGFAVRFDVEDPGDASEGQGESSVGLDHPCLTRPDDKPAEEDEQQSLFDETSLLRTAFEFCGDVLSSRGLLLESNTRGDALPNVDEPLECNLEPRASLGTSDADHLLGLHEDFRREFARELTTAVSEMVLGPCQLVRDELQHFRYLGPLRETPPRNFQPPRFPDASRWSSGLGAWDALHNGAEGLVDAVGEWLGSEEKLNAGCRVERRTYVELDRGSDAVRKLLAGRAFDDMDQDHIAEMTATNTSIRVVVVPETSDIELRPHDVGIGISQMVPVVVMALEGKNRLQSIEQPELHIHPRLQAEIADLFIEAFRSDGHHFILETHSEHLVLRLLRRIRETQHGMASPERELRTDELGVYFLSSQPAGTKASRINVDVEGEFVEPWPDDFFEIDFYERFTTGGE